MREVNPFPSKPVSQVALACLAVASLLTLVSVLWQHLSSSAAAKMGEVLTYGAVTGHVGPTAAVLGWFGVFLFFLACMGLLVMVLSIRLLESMTVTEP